MLLAPGKPLASLATGFSRVPGCFPSHVWAPTQTPELALCRRAGTAAAGISGPAVPFLSGSPCSDSEAAMERRAESKQKHVRKFKTCTDQNLSQQGPGFNPQARPRSPGPAAPRLHTYLFIFSPAAENTV